MKSETVEASKMAGVKTTPVKKVSCSNSASLCRVCGSQVHVNAFRAGHFEDSKPETAHEKPLVPRVAATRSNDLVLVPRRYNRIMGIPIDDYMKKFSIKKRNLIAIVGSFLPYAI